CRLRSSIDVLEVVRWRFSSFTERAATVLFTLSLHDALPISCILTRGLLLSRAEDRRRSSRHPRDSASDFLHRCDCPRFIRDAITVEVHGSERLSALRNRAGNTASCALQCCQSTGFIRDAVPVEIYGSERLSRRAHLAPDVLAEVLHTPGRGLEGKSSTRRFDVHALRLGEVQQPVRELGRRLRKGDVCRLDHIPAEG